MRTYYVYMLSSRSRNLYVGVTNDLAARLWQHGNGEDEFTSRYRIDRLVYYESTSDVMAAIAREKQIKSYRRAKKIALIAASNPAWNDLAEGLGLTR